MNTGMLLAEAKLGPDAHLFLFDAVSKLSNYLLQTGSPISLRGVLAWRRTSMTGGVSALQVPTAFFSQRVEVEMTLWLELVLSWGE